MSLDVSVALRWSDLDLQGHVNNVHVLRLLVEARRAALDGIVGHHMVRTHRVEYLAPLMLTDAPAPMRVSVSALSRDSFSCIVELGHGDALAARCESDCVALTDNGLPRALTEAETAALEIHLREPLGLRELPSPPMGQAGGTLVVPSRRADVGADGHVREDVVFDYVQEARIRLMAQADPTAIAGGGTHVWFLARQDVDYLAPLIAREQQYVVRSAVVGFGRTSMTTVAEVRAGTADDAAVLARLRAVLVCADLQGVPMPVPDKLKADLAEMTLASTSPPN